MKKTEYNKSNFPEHFVFNWGTFKPLGAATYRKYIILDRGTELSAVVSKNTAWIYPSIEPIILRVQGRAPEKPETRDLSPVRKAQTDLKYLMELQKTYKVRDASRGLFLHHLLTGEGKAFKIHGMKEAYVLDVRDLRPDFGI